MRQIYLATFNDDGTITLTLSDVKAESAAFLGTDLARAKIKGQNDDRIFVIPAFVSFPEGKEKVDSLDADGMRARLTLRARRTMTKAEREAADAADALREAQAIVARGGKRA